MSVELLKRLLKGVTDAVNTFMRNVVREIGEAKVYLFGSYARGDWVEDSDIDLIVVSSRFRGTPLHDRMVMLRKLAPDTRAFEILAYTPEEFDEVKHSVVIGDAMEYWIELI